MPRLNSRRRIAVHTIVAFGLLTAAVVLARSLPIWKRLESTSPPAAATPGPAPLFRDVTDEVGLDFVHVAGELQRYFFPSIMAGGCALCDLDGDGLLDMYFVNGNENQATPEPFRAAGESIRNRFYRQTAHGRFVDATDESGLGDTSFGMGVAVGDVNNDGLAEVYVTNYGPDRLYLNLGNGKFKDITEAAGIENVSWGASATFLDFDRDGWLDIYVTNYLDYFADRDCRDARGRLDFCGPQVFFPAADKLFHNLSGQGFSKPAPDSDHVNRPENSPVRFGDVSIASGIAGASGAGLGVISADFNGDFWPDIYVANDRMANYLWINQRDGTFVDEAVFRGCAFDPQGRPQAGMGIAVGDVNSDSQFDLFVTHLEGEANALYVGSDQGLFSDRSAAAGLMTPSFPFTGFGTALLDLNDDSLLDIVVANGRVKRSSGSGPSTENGWQEYAESNQIFLNTRSHRFSEVTSREPFCSTKAVSRGLATGDFDRDGDVDLLVTSIAGPARLFRNDSPKEGGWIRVRAIDPTLGGRDALGSTVTVFSGRLKWTRLISSGGSYLSANEPTAHFGMGSVERVDSIHVAWPDGTREEFEGGAVRQMMVLKRGSGKRIDASTAE